MQAMNEALGTKRLGKPRILLVDDDPDIARVLVHYLKFAGFEVEAVTDPLRAIEIAFEQPPDLVVTDLDMPGVDGSELCTLLKSRPQTRRTPVVFLSGHATQEDRDLGMFSGAVDYLDKPVQGPLLLRVIRRALSAGK